MSNSIFIAYILAIICFDRRYRRTCEEFDGLTTRPTFGTYFPHPSGGLGLYEGQPTAISGDWGYQAVYTSPGYVETMTKDGWIFLKSHPR